MAPRQAISILYRWTCHQLFEAVRIQGCGVCLQDNGDKSLQTALGRSGRVGRCFLISNMTQNAAEIVNNHLHVLVYAEAAQENTTSQTNWTLERAVMLTKNMFTKEIFDRDTKVFQDFKLVQIQVWCPFSVYAAFRNQLTSCYPYAAAYGAHFEKLAKAFNSIQENRKYFPKKLQFCAVK